MAEKKPDILPLEMPRPVSFGGLALMLVLIGVAVVGANAIASSVLLKLPVNRGYALAHGKWELMDRTIDTKKSLDVLIVGDSSSNQGLNPHVIFEDTGKTSMNFGVVAEALTVEPVWAADRFLEQSSQYGPPPKTILWMHVYDVWSRVDKNDRRLRGISASLPSTAWPYIRRGPKVKIDTKDLWLMQQVPLYFQNQSLSNLIRRPFASVEEAHRFKFDELGFTRETEPDPELVRRDTRNHKALAREVESFYPSLLSRRSIDTMSQLAEKYGCELWIVASPINRSLWEDDVFRTRWFQVRDALKSAVRRYPHVHLTFDEPYLFDDERMQNSDHVLADAAEEFTRAVIAKTGLKSADAVPADASTQPGHAE